MIRVLCAIVYDTILSTYEDQKNTCSDKYSPVYMYGNFQWANKFARTFVIFTPEIFLCSPNFNLFSKLYVIFYSRE